MSLQYPIGKYLLQEYSEETKSKWIDDIDDLPEHLRAAVVNLDEQQLQTPYRKGGWTVHQVVHHVADSHINAYCRFKLGYTEERPIIRPYDEKRWAETADVKVLPVDVSLTLLEAIHRRWVEVLKSFTDKDFQRTVYHPEHGKEFTLWHLLGMYAWHGRHHVAHITSLQGRINW